MKISDVIYQIEKFAPLSLQESYDNSGLQVGAINTEIDKVLLTTDITEAVIDEAIKKEIKLVISHHPLIFKGIKKLSGSTAIERIIIKAIKNDITLYSGHTNVDKCRGGINYKIAEKLALHDVKPLSPERNLISKIIYYIPLANADASRLALTNAKIDVYDNYDSCSFLSKGESTFRPLEGSSPYVGKIGEIHTEHEAKIEFITYNYNVSKAIQIITENHPYETPAIDVIPLSNCDNKIGLGCIGNLSQPISEVEFLEKVKKEFDVHTIKHSELLDKKISRVAVCGGSGSEFIGLAKSLKADIYITSDIKYHDFFSAENQIVIADIGHFESEHIIKEIFYEQLIKFFPNFAILKADSDMNPVNFI